MTGYFSSGMFFHVLNRRISRAKIFEDDADYSAFQRLLPDTLTHVPMQLLPCSLMPNPWHLVGWPREDGQLGEFMCRVTTTHV